MRSRTRPRSAPVAEGTESRRFAGVAGLVRQTPISLSSSRPSRHYEHEAMFKTKEALIPYLLLVAAVAGGIDVA